MSLTFRSMMVICAIILLAIISQWNSAILEGLWRYPAAIFIFAFSIEGMRARLNSPTIELVADSRFPMGEPHPLKLTVGNRHKHRLQLQMQARYTATLSGEESVQFWDIASMDSEQRRLPVTGLCLGATGIGEYYYRQLGHFGLAWWSGKYKPANELEIAPRTMARRESMSGMMMAGARSSSRLSSSGDNLLALRNYQFGDPIKSIDWKASAKRGQTTVRVFELEQSLDIMLVVDCSRSSAVNAGQLSRLNHSINIAARLSQYATSLGDQVGLLSYSTDRIDAVLPGYGERTLRLVRNSLSELNSTDDDFNPLAAALEIQSLLRQRSLIVFLCEIEQREAGEYLTKACRLLSQKHMVIVGSLIDTQVLDYQSQDNDHWLDPYRRYAAYEYLASQSLTVANLRRDGVDVVLGTGDTLDQKIMASYQRLRNRRRI